MDFFISQFISGLSITSILLMIALGLAIIYGTTGVINMAHGEFVMIGAYTSWFFQTKLGMGLIASIIPIFLITAAMGFLIERLIIRHLYNRVARYYFSYMGNWSNTSTVYSFDSRFRIKIFRNSTLYGREHEFIWSTSFNL